MSKSASVVAIVGRANVGKSSLLNAIVGRRETIVAREPGTTRDSITVKASFGGKDFWLIDTAGLKAAEDQFELSIQDQIIEAADVADAIMVVVEADVPPQAEDRQVATMALRSKKPVILVVNKLDKVAGRNLEQWQKLGIKPIVGTSTTQKIGLEELLESLSSHLRPARLRTDEGRINLALLGRPNVGKSSLFNALAAKQQALVSPQAGTTRDVNRLALRYHDHEIELADTAGIRRSGKIERGVERFSVLRALSAIEQADICLMVMDVNELNVALDQKIAGLIKEAGKGLILAISKWDMLDDKTDRNQIASEIANHFDFVPWAPLVFTSAVSGQNVTKIFELALGIEEARHARIKTPELNRWLAAAINQHPPAGLHGSSPHLKYMVQETDIDMPSFKIFGSQVKLLHWSYRRYLERRLRENWPFDGTPVKFWFIEQNNKLAN